MPSFNKTKHHIGFLRADGTTKVGLMLATDENNVPIYRTIYDKFLVNQFTTSPNDGATNPEEAMHLGQDSFKAGIGSGFFLPSSPSEYFKANGMDLRNGQGILGWGLTEIVEKYTWTTPTGTNDPDTAFANDANFIDDNITTSAPTSVAVSSSTWSSYLEATFSSSEIGGVRYYINSDNANDSFTKIDIDYYDGSWNVVVNEITLIHNKWVTLIKEATGVTKIRFRMFNPAGGSRTCSFTETTVALKSSGNEGVVWLKGVEFNSLYYKPGGLTLYRLNTDGDAFLPIVTFGSTITQIVPFQVSGTDYLFIFLGTSTDYEYMTTGEVFTTSNATDKQYQFSAWVNTTVDALYANDGANTIRSTVDPLNGGTAWSGQTVVGEAAISITHLQEKDGALLIDKEDIPFYLDSSGNVQKDLAPDAASGKSTHSGKNSANWQGRYYRPTGDQALLLIDKFSNGSVGNNDWIQPARFTRNNGDFTGQVEACVGDEEWLYVGTDNSAKIEIQCTRDEVVDGVIRRVWHPIQEITLTGIEAMDISTVVRKALWVSSTASGDSLYYLGLPTKYGDIQNDSNANFKTGGTFDTPKLHGNFKATNKYWIKLTLTMDHTFDADIYFTGKYKLLGDSAYTTIGTNFTGTSSSMVQTIFLAASSVARTSPMIEFQFTGVTDDTTKTPALINYSVEGVLYPTVRRVIECAVRVADNIKTKDGTTAVEGTDAAYIRTVLEEAQDATAPVTFYDYFGDTKTAKVMPIEPFSQVSKDLQSMNPQQVIFLRLQEIPLS